jgi:hypothetical protein
MGRENDMAIDIMAVGSITGEILVFGNDLACGESLSNHRFSLLDGTCSETSQMRIEGICTVFSDTTL